MPDKRKAPNLRSKTKNARRSRTSEKGFSSEKDTPVVHFHFDPSRSADIQKELLQGYQGTVVTDDGAFPLSPNCGGCGQWFAYYRTTTTSTLTSSQSI